MVEFDVAVLYPGGSAVAAFASAETSVNVLTAQQVVDIATAQAFVANTAPDPAQIAMPYLPAEAPAIGTVYALDIWAHCQYALIRIDGSTFRPQEPYDHTINAGSIPGTIEMLDADTARFVVDPFVRSEPDVIVYRRSTEEIPLCA